MTSHTPQRLAQLVLSLFAVSLFVIPAAASQKKSPHLTPKFSNAGAFDISAPLRDLAPATKHVFPPSSEVRDLEIRRERDLVPEVKDKGFTGDAAVQASTHALAAPVSALTIPSPLANFEGLSNQDNFNQFGFRVNPPDPNG